MQHYEYTNLPAPDRVRRFGQMRGDEVVSRALTEVMNQMGMGGWEFVGAERIVCRVGRWPFAVRRERDVLVFRRLRGERLDMAAAWERKALPPADDAIEVAVKPRRVARPDVPPKVRRLRPQLAMGTAAE